jgi:hypothetical protein
MRLRLDVVLEGRYALLFPFAFGRRRGTASGNRSEAEWQ